MRLHDSLVDLQVCGRTGQALNVDTPLLLVEIEGRERTVLAKNLNLIDVLVASVVTSTRVSLRVLVGHDGSERIVDRSRGNVLGSDQRNSLPLTGDLALLDSISTGRVHDKE